MVEGEEQWMKKMVQGKELWVIEDDEMEQDEYPIEKLYRWLKLVQAKELAMGEEEKNEVNEP